MLNAPSTKLIDLVNSTIVSSTLDAFGVNYSAFDINGNAIVKNKSMESTISKGEIIAEKIDQSAWEDCKKIMKSLKGEITEEEFKGKYYLSMKQPIMENNQCVGIVIISFDISEKKQAELAKSAFVMNMAHDIRTPFSAIVGLAQYQAMYGSKTPQEVKDNGTMIYQSGNQLLEILDSVVVALDKNNIDDIKKDKIDLYKFSQEMQELIKPNIALSNLEFELKVDKDIGEIVTDKIRLKQTLVNLLSNAVNFTPEGKVTLSFGKTDKVTIKVSDTGIGIHKDNHERIFKQYEKIKPSYKSSTFTGVGMGLYLVKKLLGDLKGTITLESELEKGSTFTIELPFL